MPDDDALFGLSDDDVLFSFSFACDSKKSINKRVVSSVVCSCSIFVFTDGDDDIFLEFLLACVFLGCLGFGISLFKISIGIFLLKMFCSDVFSSVFFSCNVVCSSVVFAVDDDVYHV